MILVMLLLLAGCGGEHTSRYNDTYTCPMHPTILSDRTGACPVCGMDLVRKAQPGEEVEITDELARLIKSPNEVVVASVRTIRGEYKSLSTTVAAQGVVAYDTRNIAAVPARAAGRLEKTYIKYALQPVRKGQKIAELYSPELLASQRELLLLLEGKADPALVDAAKRKLSLLGMSGPQIAQLMTERKPGSRISLYSPRAGYVVPSAADDASLAATPFPREGAYVTAGQTLFVVVNTQTLKVDFDLPVGSGTDIRQGDTVYVNTGDGRERISIVDSVIPIVENGINFSRFRIYLRDTGGLQPGRLVRAEIRLRQREALWVPREAVSTLGRHDVVFVHERGAFRPKVVVTGVSSGDKVEIISGLASTDEIAANARFLVDSDSFIKP